MLATQGALPLPPPHGQLAEIKYGEYRLLAAWLTLAFAALILLQWAWDWSIDATAARETIAPRLAAAAIALLPGLALARSSSPGAAGISLYGAMLAIELLLTLVLGRLEMILSATVTGYLYFVLALVLLGLPFSFRLNLLGSLLVAAAPHLWGEVVTAGFPHFTYAVLVWPAFAIGVLFHWSTDRLIRAGLRSHARAAALSLQDPLTGLANRRALDAEFARATRIAERHDEPLSLLLLDVDRFKGVNDSYGHAAGDRILRELAALMHSSSRANDALARIGGEEFVCLMPGADLGDARAAGERLREAVERTIEEAPGPGGRPAAAVTISLGAAQWQSPESLTDLLARADQALYLAKNKGRNRLETA